MLLLGRAEKVLCELRGPGVLTAVCVSIEPRFGRELIALHAEQAYAPTIPSAHRLQRPGSTFTNAAVRRDHFYSFSATAEG